jgi:hypothetical protein
MSLDTLLHPAPSSRADATVAVPGAGRHDIYVNIHRALRLFMTDTLGRLGWLDTDDAEEVAATVGQLGALLAMCRGHAESENRFVHTAIEARRPGASLRVAEEHEEQHATLAALEAEAAALAAAPTPALAQRLYRHLALFIAENFAHMHVEETALNQALWAAHDDAEIRGIEERIVAALPAEKMGLVLRWMTPALPPAERAGWLGAMQQSMPPEAFRGVLEVVRPTLDDKAWAKLARALHLPAQPWPARV